MRRSKLLGALLVSSACCFALLGCGGSSFDGRVYRAGEIAFRVGPIPASWRRIEIDQTLLAYRDNGKGSTVALNGRCGLDGDDVPLKALTHHLFLQFTARDIRSQKLIELDGREALRSELVAELDGVPKHYLVYVLKKDGCVYDFVHVSDGAEGDAEFDRFVAGFSTEGLGNES